MSLKQASAPFLKELPKNRYARQITHLNLLSNYPGSAIKLDSSKIQNIQLIMRNKGYLKSFELKQFWKYNLRTINFYNPEIPVQVTRIESSNKEEIKDIPSLIRIAFKDGTTKEINCANKDQQGILNSFIKETNAEKVPEEEIVVIRRN